MAFPGATPSYVGFTPGHTLLVDVHASQHNAEQTDIIALANKVGTGASTPTSGLVLRGNGVGTSAWGQVILTSDISGVLPVANGGTGIASLGAGMATFLGTPNSANLLSAVTDETGSGPLVFGTTPTLSVPVIADFTSANHTHASTAQGGQLNATNALQNSTVTADKLSTGAATQSVATSQTTTSSTAGDLATAGPTVTVAIGVNGVALVCMSVDMLNSTTDYNFVYLIVSGANTIAAKQYLLLQGTNEYQFGTTFLLTGLTAGSTTFKMQYSNFNNASTATFKNRNISVVPL